MPLKDLEKEVAEKLARVEDTLSKVEGVHRDLQENAQHFNQVITNRKRRLGSSDEGIAKKVCKVEQKIHEAADRQVEALRVRERQLVRQVQVVTHLESEGLRSRLAGLMHKKGALTATHNLLARCSRDDAATLSKITVEDVDMQGDIQSMGELMVQFDEAPLSSAISKFGSVQLPERITHHTSPIIPTSVEEYEDDEHHVLHKSVASAVCVPGAPVHVTVQFPRLTNNSWLAKNQSQNANDKRAPPKDGLQPNMINKTNDIASWLTGLHLGTGHNEETDSFDMLTDNAPSSRSDSSSIEIVPSNFGSEKESCGTPPSSFEIENLHMYVGEKSRWLNTKSGAASTASLKQQLQISSACQANEVCQSFNDCVCRNKCKEAALEKLQQSADYKAKMGRKRTYSEAEGIDSVIDHMVKIRASENSGWLVKQLDMHPNLPVPVKRVLYQSPVGDWLRLTGCPTFTSAPKFKLHLATHSNIWLLKNLKSQKRKDAIEKEENEKDNEKDIISTDDLSEALKKVSVSYNKDNNNGWVLDNSPKNILDTLSKNSTSKVTFIESEQPWLLCENLGNGRHSRDNRLEEKDAANKKQWLINSSKNHQMQKALGASDDMVRKKNLEAVLSSDLPEKVLAVAQVDINNWLMKNCI